MKKIFIIAGLSAALWSCGSKTASTNDLATSNPIHTSIDLTQVVDDKAPVTINPGRFTQDTVIYRIPRVVQGTYSVSDFGRYIEDLKAYDYQGNTLDVNKLDTNSWSIPNAKELDYITYYVNDSFDQETVGGIGGEDPFSPAGTNIEPDNYVLNLHGFIGYFDNLKNAQYTLDVTAPATFERSSALQQTDVKSSSDGKTITTSYFAPRYFDITDNPMMYGDLDVEEFTVGNIKIVLSVYSPNKKHSAGSLKETMYNMMKAQKAYLGDINSTPRYDIFLYLSDGRADGPKGFGALEHHTSTVVVMRENESKEELAESMVDIVSHEFFHIVTPLSVHSEDIHYFDYNQPSFSKHLWMYEGVTEYFAQHFQVYEGLEIPEDFYKVINTKINRSMMFDDTMSFTQMSENILDDPYAKNYLNVYQKGALIGMCIDILMREESNGHRSMLTLMKELSNKYGVNKPFEDDNLISEITSMTYPSIGEFLQTHVVDGTPIDYETILNKVGLQFAEEQVETNYLQSASGFILKGDPEKGTVFFTDAVQDNSFWREQGVQANDYIKEVNGVKLNLQNTRSILGQVFQWMPDQEINVVLEREGKEVPIKTTLTKTYTTVKTIVENPNATEAQRQLRKVWLNQ